MYLLETALDSFNRKERNLLVRAILGQEGPLYLSQRFRGQVATKLGLTIPEDASWATDYHISWLAGALALFVKGEDAARDSIWPNPLTLDTLRPNSKKPDGRRLVEGNQEDIDLVIATGSHLVLIEAKAYGSWDNGQVASKLARLKMLHDFYREMVQRAPSGQAVKAVNFHLLLTSPNRPAKLAKFWPNWACKGEEMPWIQLEIDEPSSVFEVTRCGAEGKKDAAGGDWRVIKARTVAGRTTRAAA